MTEKTARVSVRSEPHDVTVYQKSKTVRIATGEYQGTPIQTKGRYEGSAVKLWRKMAEYWPNAGLIDTRRPRWLTHEVVVS